MKLATTTEGVARVEGDDALLLDVPFADLGEVLAAGALADLATAPVTGRRR